MNSVSCLEALYGGTFGGGGCNKEDLLSINVSCFDEVSKVLALLDNL